ncbi:6918_t:CDS:2, partial [Racocetra fulgida]
AYSCDPSTCKSPKCFCAGTTPPGGLSLDDTPQFVLFTSDNGLYNDCWKGFCDPAKLKIPGFFEIPMSALIGMYTNIRLYQYFNFVNKSYYQLLDEQGLPHLMDPYLDNTTDV